FRDNLGFMDRASGEHLQVALDPGGIVAIRVQPSRIRDEGDNLTIAAHTAVVASKAIWSTYPAVQRIDVSVVRSFTDAYGAVQVETTAMLQIKRATGEKFVYDGLKARVEADNTLLFCTADGYRIQPA